MPRRTGQRSSGSSDDAGSNGQVLRLQQQIRDGETYEALQTTRALFARMERSGKRGGGGEARAILLKVASTLAEAGEFKSALDLARLYMTNNKRENGSTAAAGGGGAAASGNRVEELSAKEARETAAIPSSSLSKTETEEEDHPSWIPHRFATGGRVAMLSLARMLPQGSKERVSLLKGITRWAVEEQKQQQLEEGEEEEEGFALGLELAEAYKDYGDYAQAALKHAQLALGLKEGGRGGARERLAASYVGLLEHWSEDGYKGEKDLFVARAAMHVLASSPPSSFKSAVAFARALLTAAAASSSLGSSLAPSPLAHYVSLLLDLLEADGGKEGGKEGELFRLLSSRYQPVLRRDPLFEKWVGRIAEVGFGLLPPVNPMQALMNSMMGGLGGGGGGAGMGSLLGNMLGGGAGGGGGLLGQLGGLGF